jgi:hypothetical protein
MRILEKMPADEPHRLYHAARASAVLERWTDVIDSTERLERLHPSLTGDLVALRGRALLMGGRVRESIAVLAAGVDAHPGCPDVFHALLQASGVGFLGACTSTLRAGPSAELVATPATCGRVARGLVEAGLMRPSLISFLAESSSPDADPAPETTPHSQESSPHAHL